MKLIHWIPAAALLALSACSGGGGSGMTGGGGGGTISLSATDAPFAFDIVTEAKISVDRITILPGDGDDGPIVLYEGNPVELDLLALRNGVTRALVTQHDLPAGDYRQLRLRVVDARLVLTNGNVYTTDDGTIHLSSQGTSGFKVFVDPPIEVLRDHDAAVLLDFDMTHTFHPIPANDALSANRFNLHPVIHVSNLGETGGIQGHVLRDDGAGGTDPVASATVYVLPPGETDPSQAVATTGTNAQGGYAFLGLVPGTYDVRAVKEADEAAVAGVVVTVAHVTPVDVVFGTSGLAGSVSGTVTQDVGGSQVPASGATLHLLPPGVSDPAQAIATTTTAADGTYAFADVAVGTYDVLAILGAAQVAANGVVVGAGVEATVDLAIP